VSLRIFKSIKAKIASAVIKIGAISISWYILLLLLSAVSWIFWPSKVFWEFVEYIGAAIVTFGVIGEYLKEFKEFPKDIEKRGKFAEWSVIVLIFGLVIELFGLVRTSQISAFEIAKLKQPRTFDMGQIEAIENSLNGAMRGKILISHVNEAGANSLAYIVGVVFGELGYDVKQRFPVTDDIIIEQTSKSGKKIVEYFDGIEVMHNDKQPAYGLRIENAFKSANVSVRDGATPELDANTVHLNIYERP
jgi:hypothetical protein